MTQTLRIELPPISLEAAKKRGMRVELFVYVASRLAADAHQQLSAGDGPVCVGDKDPDQVVLIDRAISCVSGRVAECASSEHPRVPGRPQFAEGSPPAGHEPRGTSSVRRSLDPHRGRVGVRSGKIISRRYCDDRQPSVDRLVAATNAVRSVWRCLSRARRGDHVASSSLTFAATKAGSACRRPMSCACRQRQDALAPERHESAGP
jgi:hypothetical protein